GTENLPSASAVTAAACGALRLSQRSTTWLLAAAFCPVTTISAPGAPDDTLRLIIEKVVHAQAKPAAPTTAATPITLARSVRLLVRRLIRALQPFASVCLCRLRH